MDRIIIRADGGERWSASANGSSASFSRLPAAFTMASELDSDGLTVTSYRSKQTAAAAGLLRRAAGGRAVRAASQQEEAYLAMQEEWLRGKAKERQTEEKVKQ